MLFAISSFLGGFSSRSGVYAAKKLAKRMRKALRAGPDAQHWSLARDCLACAFPDEFRSNNVGFEQVSLMQVQHALVYTHGWESWDAYVRACKRIDAANDGYLCGVDRHLCAAIPGLTYDSNTGRNYQILGLSGSGKSVFAMTALSSRIAGGRSWFGLALNDFDCARMERTCSFPNNQQTLNDPLWITTIKDLYDSGELRSLSDFVSHRHLFESLFQDDISQVKMAVQQGHGVMITINPRNTFGYDMLAYGAVMLGILCAFIPLNSFGSFFLDFSLEMELPATVDELVHYFKESPNASLFTCDQRGGGIGALEEWDVIAMKPSPQDLNDFKILHSDIASARSVWCRHNSWAIPVTAVPAKHFGGEPLPVAHV